MSKIIYITPKTLALSIYLIIYCGSVKSLIMILSFNAIHKIPSLMPLNAYLNWYPSNLLWINLKSLLVYPIWSHSPPTNKRVDSIFGFVYHCDHFLKDLYCSSDWILLHCALREIFVLHQLLRSLEINCHIPETTTRVKLSVCVLY